MLFEFLSDFIPFLYTVSFLLTVIGLYVNVHISTEFLKNQCSKQYVNARQLVLAIKQPSIEYTKEMQNWITRCVKRKEGPESDSDYTLSLISRFIFKIEEGIHESAKVYISYIKKIKSPFISINDYYIVIRVSRYVY